MRLVNLKCPECGGEIELDLEHKISFCPYCGSKLLLENENEKIIHNIDDAKIKQAETDRMVKMKKLEIEDERRRAYEKHRSFKIKISILLGILALIGLGIGFSTGAYGLAFVGEVACFILLFMWMNSDKEEDYDIGDKIRVPSGINDFESKNYTVIQEIFKNAGFTNVKCIPLNDLTFGLLMKPGTVASITIKGQEITSGGRKFSPEAPVVISYHSHR